ncbi:hypothetical protein KJ966_29525 [bacterium]|nr:hypothetical protein [bacterium]
MTDRNLSWFYAALIVSCVIHFSAISPLSKWLNKTILPAISDESIEIDISELKKQPPLKQAVEQIPPNPVVPLSPPETKPIDIPELPEKQKEIILNPKHKKLLDETIEKDVVIDQKQEIPFPDPSARKTVRPEEEKPLTEASPPVKEEKPPVEISQVAEEKKEQVPVETSRTEELIESTEEDNAVSPLFLKKSEPEIAGNQQNKEDKKIIPEEIKETFRNDAPEPTASENLEYSMNTYKWSFKRYMENWAVDIQKWWKAPLDYKYGRVPEGGNMWIQVKLAKSGRLLGYRIVQSSVTAEMELMVIQALVGSLKQPPMPDPFPKDELVINWQFIYPPIRPEINLRR